MRRSIHKIYMAACLLLGALTACIEEDNISPDRVTGASEPALSAIRIVGITASTVTLEGEVEASNGYPITERGIVWGTSPSPDIERDSHHAMADNNSGTIRLTAENLLGATTYYFSLYATNRAGTGYSDPVSTTTEDGLGTVTTFIIEANIRATTAVAGGLIGSRGEGDIAERGVYYWSKEVAKDSIISISPMERDSFFCNLSGLLPALDYWVQAYVKNSYGVFKGDSVLLATGTGRPVLSNSVTIYPESNSAQVLAHIDHIGDAPLIRRGFCWSKDLIPRIEDNMATIPIYPGDDGAGFMATALSPLDPNQVYYVSAFAQNTFGITYTSPQQFITTSHIPTLITLEPISIVDGAAIFGGRIINVGESNVVRIGVCYSTVNERPDWRDTRVELTTSPISGNNLPYDFRTQAITGLRGGTTYYIRAFAINGNEIPSYGEPTILQTPPIFTLESASNFDGGMRIEGSSAYFVINDRGYLLGGDIGPTYISSLYSYNPALSESRWGQLRSYEGGSMIWQSAAVIETRVFVLGGLGTGNVAKDDFYVYNIVDNRWFDRAKGPDPAYSRTGFSLNDEVVYVGGMKDTANNEVWAFHVNANTWSRKADFPVNQYDGIALTINGTVYAGLGKNTAGVGNRQLWKSSGALTGWVAEPTGSELSGNILAGAVFNDKIYVIDKPSHNRYILFEYNPATQEWKRKSELPTNYNCQIQFMYSIGNRIYIGFANNDKVVSYDPLWDN